MGDTYALLDVGDGARLERFGPYVVARPAPAASWPRRTPADWDAADLCGEREGGWSGPRLAAARAEWTVRVGGLALELRPTESGQVGLFPEHARQLDWLSAQVATRRTDAAATGSAPVEVLHLFAYTGLTTLALARDAAAVTHVDASRPTVGWARTNATVNGLDGRPIRWIVDDVASFVAREGRRGRRYDGIVLDPPSYGHGRSGRSWQVAADLPDLLVACRAILRDDGFMLLTAHSEGLGPDRLADMVSAALFVPEVPRIWREEMTIRATSGAVLRLGAAVRLDRRRAGGS